MEFKRNLKKLINDKDIKVSQLSRATKIPQTTLQNWIQGHPPKNINQIKAVADYFGVTLDYLCFGISPKTEDLFESKREEINACGIVTGKQIGRAHV